MAKPIQHRGVPQKLGHPRPATPARTARGEKPHFELLWSVISAGFGALAILSFLAPADSISVSIGSALPQNLGWLLLAALAAVASRN